MIFMKMRSERSKRGNTRGGLALGMHSCHLTMHIYTSCCCSDIQAKPATHYITTELQKKQLISNEYA